MIQFGSTICSLNNPDLDAWLNQNYDFKSLQPFLPNAHIEFTRGNNLVFTQWGNLPPVRVNELVIPTGATRWGYMFLLCNTEQKDAILTEYGAIADAAVRIQPAVMSLTFNAARGWNAAGLQAPGTPNNDGPVVYQMAPLAPRRITAAHTEAGKIFGDQASGGLVPQGVWLIPLVDERYFWQYHDVGDIAGVTLDTGQEVLDHVLQAVAAGVSTIRPGLEIDDIYLDEKPDITGNDYENAAVLLEHLMWHFGTKIIPDMYAHTSSTGGWMMANVQHCFTNAENIRDRNNSGELLDIGTGGTPGVLSVGTPALAAGGDDSTAGSGWLPSTILFEKPDGTWDSQTSATTNGVKIIPDTQLRIRLAHEEEPAATYYQKWAEDYLDMVSRSNDRLYNGTQNYQLTVSDDYVIHRQAWLPDGRGFATTRVFGIGHNHFPVKPAGGDGGQAASDCDCCQCVCIDPNLQHPGGFLTVRHWNVELTENTEWARASNDNGDVRVRSGTYQLSWNEGTSRWERDLLVGNIDWRNDNGDISVPTTVTASMYMEWTSQSDPVLIRIDFDGTGDIFVPFP